MHEREVARRRRTEREAVTGGGDRGGQQLGPGGGAVALVRPAEGREGARRGHRAVARVHREPAAVRRVDLAHAGAEALAGQPPAGHLDVPVDHHRAPSAGQMLTKAPPSGLTTPGSVTVATSMAAIAASTAEPPAWMRSMPAWAARGLVAATAARLFTRRLSATGAAGARRPLAAVRRGAVVTSSMPRSAS